MSSVERMGGTLRPDGVLELDRRPGLAPGRVTVRLEADVPKGAAPGSLAETLRRIQADQRARGFVGLGAQELADEQSARREDDALDERRWEAIWSQTDSGAPD